MVRKIFLFSSGGLLLLFVFLACLRIGRYAPGTGRAYPPYYPLQIIGNIAIPVTFGFTLSETLSIRKNNAKRPKKK